MRKAARPELDPDNTGKVTLGRLDHWFHHLKMKQRVVMRREAKALFDSYSAGYGGSGHGFDYRLLADVKADSVSRPLILSGGLTPDNVASAVQSVRPWAVDVSSGVEVEQGIKSSDRISFFVAAVQAADAKR